MKRNAHNSRLFVFTFGEPKWIHFHCLTFEALMIQMQRQFDFAHFSSSIRDADHVPGSCEECTHDAPSRLPRSPSSSPQPESAFQNHATWYRRCAYVVLPPFARGTSELRALEPSAPPAFSVVLHSVSLLIALFVPRALSVSVSDLRRGMRRNGKLSFIILNDCLITFVINVVRRSQQRPY